MLLRDKCALCEARYRISYELLFTQHWSVSNKCRWFLIRGARKPSPVPLENKFVYIYSVFFLHVRAGNRDINDKASAVGRVNLVTPAVFVSTHAFPSVCTVMKYSFECLICNEKNNKTRCSVTAWLQHWSVLLTVVCLLWSVLTISHHLGNTFWITAVIKTFVTIFDSEPCEHNMPFCNSFSLRWNSTVSLHTQSLSVQQWPRWLECRWNNSSLQSGDYTQSCSCNKNVGTLSLTSAARSRGL